MMYHKPISYELSSYTIYDRKKYAFESNSSLALHIEPFSHIADEPQATAALDRGVWRKLDLWLLPTVAMFYLLSFLVRQKF